MASAEQLMAPYEDLRGKTITASGWEGLVEHAHTRPPVQVVNDCFTDYMEEVVAANTSGDLTGDPERTVDLLRILSNPDDSKALERAFWDINKHAGSMGLHMDPGLGDIYLANFEVKGNPSYLVFPHLTDDIHEYTGSWNTQFFTKTDPQKPERISIQSKQLVILGGAATTGYMAENKDDPFPEDDCTVPHTVEVSEGEGRTLLMAHALNAYKPQRALVAA